MSQDMIENIVRQTGCDSAKVAEIATLVLRELHLASATHDFVTTGAIMECFYNFGLEACYHLGGILMYHDDGTNDPSNVTESLMPETMMRFIGFGDDVREIRDRWLEYLESHRQAGR